MAAPLHRSASHRFRSGAGQRAASESEEGPDHRGTGRCPQRDRVTGAQSVRTAGGGRGKAESPRKRSRTPPCRPSRSPGWNTFTELSHPPRCSFPLPARTCTRTGSASKPSGRSCSRGSRTRSTRSSPASRPFLRAGSVALLAEGDLAEAVGSLAPDGVQPAHPAARDADSSAWWATDYEAYGRTRDSDRGWNSDGSAASWPCPAARPSPRWPFPPDRCARAVHAHRGAGTPFQTAKTGVGLISAGLATTRPGTGTPPWPCALAPAGP